MQDTYVMDRTKRKALFGCLGSIAIIIGIMIYIIYHFFFSMSHLPEGELINKVDSPNKKYSIAIYRVDGGATSRYSLRGELINNQNNSSKNIYWGYDEKNATIEWIDEYTVLINKRKLDVRKDKYDFRKVK